jgi:putative FmdB family regulatory protein
MPIYEYKCSACGEVTEKLCKIADRNNPTLCKTCHAVAHPILSSFSVQGQSSLETRDSCPNHDHGTGKIQIINSTFKNAKVGISVPKGTNIQMKGNRFENVEKHVEFRDK